MPKITITLIALFLTTISVGQNSIAITEFLTNPAGDESTDEFVELYNYGSTPVDIQNWTLSDEDADNDIIIATSYVLQPGELYILAKNKTAFEANWLGGVANSSVINFTDLTLSNSTDELILRDATTATVWSLAYGNDETSGRATHYTETSTFATTVWGSKAVPGIDRAGNDPATGTLGYERNNTTTDPDAFTAVSGDIGSPLSITIVVPTACATTSTYTIAGGWDNGTPDANTQAIISEDYTTTTANLTVCDLVVNSGATLTINGGEWTSVASNIVVDGTLIIEHEGSLVQIDGAGTVTKGAMGVIQVKKTTPTLAPLGFMFLSSPMTAETRDGVYTNSFRTIEVVSSNFTVDPALVTTDPMDPYFGAEIFLGPDNSFLSNYVASETLVPGDGLVVYPQSSITDGGMSYDLTYTQGVLNNGDISYPIQYNGIKEDNFNLLGNPYASAIDMDMLIDNNDMISEVYFWEHITAPDNTIPGYNNNNYSMDDISIYTKTGAVGSGTMADNGGTAPGRYIASGQGFAIKADQGGSANAVFTNAMRVTDNNDQYRVADRDRIWLTVTNEEYNLQSTALVGFFENTSERFDQGYDAKRVGSGISLFSKASDNTQLSIQALGAFDTSIKVPFGFASVIESIQNFEISIEQMEGALINEPVFLVDKLTRTVTNLQESSYRFTSNRGSQNNRFLMVFEAPEVLGIENNSLKNNVSMYPNPAKDELTISVNNQEVIRNIEIMNYQGQVVHTIDAAAINQSTIVNVQGLSDGVYLVLIEGTNGSITKKLIIQ